MRRRWLRPSVIVAAFVMLFSMVFHGLVLNPITGMQEDVLQVEALEDLRTTTANLNLRSGPGTGYAILAVIPKGTVLSVQSVSGSWAKVTYSGKTGYVHTAYLTAPSSVILVTTAALNLRSGPGTTYPVIAVMPKGTEVVQLSISGNWAQVRYGTMTGYASRSYLVVKGSTQPVEDLRITTTTLNLRSGPGTSYSILTVMPKGAQVKVLSVSGVWAKVVYQSLTGYAHTGYLVKVTTGLSTKVYKGILTASTKQIALTFDAGWEYSTVGPLLDMLDHYGVKATFFLRAYWVRDHADLAKEIQRRGHAIQNHSLTHPHMKTMTESQIRYEFTESTRIFQSVLGITPTLFRPPYGEYDDRVLRIALEQGYRYTVLWSIDTADWAETSGGVPVTSTTITDRVLSGATDKDIVLMHVAFQKTVDALPRMIETLKARGYVFKTVPQMLP